MNRGERLAAAVGAVAVCGAVEAVAVGGVVKRAADQSSGVTERLIPPRERACERCGRRDTWDERAENWCIDRAGRPHCIHEWDINGTYSPFDR